MYWTAFGPVQEQAPRVRPLLPDVATTPQRRRPALSPARALVPGSAATPGAATAPAAQPGSARHTAARRRRPASAPPRATQRNDAAASARAKARWAAASRKLSATTALRTQRRSMRDLGRGPPHRTYVPDASTRRRLMELEAAGAGDAWDYGLGRYCFTHLKRTANGPGGDPQTWVAYVVRDGRAGASAEADAAAAELAVDLQRRSRLRVRVLDGVAPPPSCGACVAADAGGAACSDHARPCRVMATGAAVAAPGVFDVYALRLPSAGCVPPCPRCGAARGHAAPPPDPPRLYRLGSRFADGGRFPALRRCARALRAAAAREGTAGDDEERAAAALRAYDRVPPVACRVRPGAGADVEAVAAFCRARAALRACPPAALASFMAAWRAAGYSEDDAVFVEAAARADEHNAASRRVRAAPAAARFAERCGPFPRRRRAPAAEPVGVVFLE